VEELERAMRLPKNRALRGLLPGLKGLLGERIVQFRNTLHVREEFTTLSPAVNLLSSGWSAWWPTKTVLFFPEVPHWSAVEFKLCALLGYAMTSDPNEDFDVAFKRKDATFFESAILKSIPVSANRILNARSVDISKRTVGNVFGDVFGYPLDVDPTRYEGEIVEKSDANAAHDGRIIQGPLFREDIRPGRVYQRLIDNASEQKGFVLDYRLPIYGDEIPLVYLEHRPLETRFSWVDSFAKLGDLDALFSRQELDSILLLARRMGIDYGEFDVLRDRDGRVYVIDTNNTPAGPPPAMPAPEQKVAMECLGESFRRLLDRWSV
jgi:hypothetical protein